MQASRRLSFRPSAQPRQPSEGIILRYKARDPLIKIENGTFYRQYPVLRDEVAAQEHNRPLFPNLTFSLPSRRPKGTQDLYKSHRTVGQQWAVIGEAGKRDFLDVLRGRYISIPPTARSFPYFSSERFRNKTGRSVAPEHAIQYVGFGGEKLSSSSGLRGAYLSARYESRREESDWTVLQYLRGDTELNPLEPIDVKASSKSKLLQKVMESLRLEKLAHLPVSNLSNGQTRRARIAKALLSQPEVLLLDEPFMGLDPPSMVALSPMLRKLAEHSNPRLVLSLRPQDPIPEWITHLIFLGSDNQVALQGPIYSVLLALQCWRCPVHTDVALARAAELTRAFGSPPSETGNILTQEGICEDQYLSASLATLRTQDPSQISSLLPRSLLPHDESHDHRYRNLLKDIRATLAQSGATCTPDAVFNLGLFLYPNLRASSPSKQVDPLSVSDTPQSASDLPQTNYNPALVELEDIVVRYGSKVVLGGTQNKSQGSRGLNLDIRSGTRLAILGPNGSGKTTLLSLLTSDHPQSYSLPIKFFGRTRLPSPGTPGISLFDIQKNIGHSSPEIHAFFPRHLTIRQSLESAFSDAFLGKPLLNDERNADIDALLQWFAPEFDPYYKFNPTTNEPIPITWATSKAHAFGSLNFHQQRFLLLLRALVKKPSIVILDEAFSGFPSRLREKAMCFLECGQTKLPEMRNSSWEWSSVDSVQSGASLAGTVKILGNRFNGLSNEQALVVVSHVKEEIPSCVNEWLRLPGEEEVEVGKNVEKGHCRPGQLRTKDLWNKIWSL